MIFICYIHLYSFVYVFIYLFICLFIYLFIYLLEGLLEVMFVRLIVSYTYHIDYIKLKEEVFNVFLQIIYF